MVKSDISHIRSVPVDYTNTPIPAEIKDLEEFLKPKIYDKVTDENRPIYVNFVKGLLGICIPGCTVKDFEDKTKKLRRIFKVCPKKSLLLQTYWKLLEDGLIEENLIFEDYARKKRCKSQSGISSITVVMKPDEHSCDMDCHYCPNDPSISRSYLLKEPAVKRGFENGWDATRQFNKRYTMLKRNGHLTTKIELIIKGGTFGNYSDEYCREFIRDLYYTANILAGIIDSAPDHIKNMRIGEEKLTLSEEQTINKHANCAIIGLTIETRPDWIFKKQILLFRELGVTRVELGVQHIDEEILDLVNRQCPNEKTVKGIRLLKQNGFKVDLHFMPDLPGSSFKKDMAMFKYLFSSDNVDFQGDQLKIYPCMTLPFTKIKEWHEAGIYKPYAKDNSGKDMFKLLIWICTNVPFDKRINRVIRDMNTEYISGGVDKINMRQDLIDYMKANNLKGTDIRAREAGDKEFNPDTARLFIDVSRASEGTEYFISLEDDCRETLYGFVRLRLSDDPYKDVFFESIKGLAFIRELHVYGDLVHQTKSTNESNGKVQHRGIGKLLISIAEKIALENGWPRMAIISGVGVRRYYENRGYSEQDTYMIKDLRADTIIAPPEHFEKYYDLNKTNSDNVCIITHTPINRYQTIGILLIIMIIVYTIFLSIYLYG